MSGDLRERGGWRAWRVARVCLGALIGASLTGCGDSTPPLVPGAIVLNVASAEAGATAMVDRWRVTITGPSGPQSREGTPGQSVQFTQLQPGGYSVLLEGLEGGEVAQRGTTAVTVAAGVTATATLSPSAVLPDVVVTASDPQANEAGPDAGAFTVTRVGGSTAAALSVNVAASGSATSGADYRALLSSVVIAAGQRTQIVMVDPVLDAVNEGTETVVLTAQPGGGYTVGSPNAASVDLSDAPIVTVVATSPNASEVGLVPGQFTLSRTGPVTASLTVTVQVGGTATSGVDYSAIAASHVIPAGQTAVVVPIAPVADGNGEGAESVMVTVVPNTASYAVGGANTATVTIADAPLIGLADFVFIQAGTFQMGSTNAFNDEQPVHQVAISRPFYMQRTEVTQAQWVSVMADNPSYSRCGLSCPVEQVSWTEVQVFIQRLNQATPGVTYRLPTEAEWEYAARAATPGDYGGTGALDQMAWYDGNASGDTHPVATRVGNAWGLYDMLGNVWEWTQDCYGAYQAGAQIDPTGAPCNTIRTVRGGGWNSSATNLRVSRRLFGSPSFRVNYYGFRLVRESTLPPVPVVTISAPDGNAAEAGADPATFRLSRTGSTAASLTVAISMSGSATIGVDYHSLTSPRVIPAGATSVDVQLVPNADALVEGSEQATMTVVNGSDYIVGSPSAATVTIADAPPPIALADFSLIPAGTFQMGSTNGNGDEQPVHSVTISRPFYLQKTEVTQAQWQAVMGSNPSYFAACGPTCPVEQVSWDDVQLFISTLNERSPGITYRLPTEAEWEYAARATTTTDYGGNNVLSEMGWYGGNSQSRTWPVAQKVPNAWGLYDMHGNVWEWVQDWYGQYGTGAGTDPTGPATGSHGVLRGGSWRDGAFSARSAYRFTYIPSYRSFINGFRLARTQ